MYSVIIVGLGKIGMGYDLCDPNPNRISTIARAVARSRKYNLLCGVDSCKDKRDGFVSSYKRPAYSTFVSAMDDGLEPDVVVIATPTHTHFNIFNEILGSADPISILCEKPFSGSVRSAIKMLELAEERSIHLAVNYMRRCDNAFLRLRRLLEVDLTGGVLTGVCFYSGGIYNTASHFINIFEFLFGKVSDVKGVEFPNSPISNRESFDPTPNFTLIFNGARITFVATHTKYSVNRFVLFSDRHRIEYERDGIRIYPVMDDPLNIGYKIVSDLWGESIDTDNLVLQKRTFDGLIDYLEGAPSTICTGKDAVETLRTIDRIENFWSKTCG